MAKKRCCRVQEMAILGLWSLCIFSLWRLWRSDGSSVESDAMPAFMAPSLRSAWAKPKEGRLKDLKDETEDDEDDDDEEDEDDEDEEDEEDHKEANTKADEPGQVSEQDSDSAMEPTPAPQAERECNLFTLWEYPNGAPEYVRVNVESWRRHAHGRCSEPIFLNEQNIRQYIPDLPEEYFKIPYQAARSDVVRYAVIYHNGGIYMDTDFLVQEDLDPVIDVLNLDLVSYSGSNRQGKQCPSDFSSNFLGGRKGSIFHKKVYEAQIRKMQNHCPRSQKGKTVKGKEQFCCFAESDVKCDVPWASIGEGISHPEMNRMLRDGEEFTSYCFAGSESFVPADMEGVLLHSPLYADAMARFDRGKVKNPLGRIAYHLFNSMTSLQTWSCKKLSSNATLVGSLYLRSFTHGAGSRLVTGEDADAFMARYPEFKEQNRLESIVPCVQKNPFAKLKLLKAPSGKSNGKCNIFSIASPAPDDTPNAVELNVESWRKHTEGLCNEPILVNDSNVRSFIPDLPEEYFQLPGPQEKLDLIRHGLLYHHGGIVLQWDVVFLRNMRDVVQKLSEFDLVSSSERQQGQGNACGDDWQVLFTAGKLGSRFHGAAWQAVRDAVTSHCPLKDKDKEKLCCFAEPNQQCHVPGGALSALSLRVKKDYEGDDQAMRSYCYSEAQSFRPANFQQILDHKPMMEDGEKSFKSHHGGQSFLDSYALFLPVSMTQDFSCREIFNTEKVIGAVYSSSFGISSQDEIPCKRRSIVRALVKSLSPPVLPSRCHLFSLAGEEKVAAKLNLASWQLHMPEDCSTVLITDENVKSWVPDLPEEYFKLPGPEEKLDFLRHGLLFHNGGIVMKREMVVTESLENLVKIAASVDIISSAEDKFGDSTQCGGSFQANQILGGQQGSSYHGVAWHVAKQAVQAHCPLEDRSKEIICCFDEDVSCHIPGGSLGEGMSVKVKRWFEGADFSLKSHCLSEQQSFRPAWFQFVLDHKPRLKEAKEYFKEERQMDLLNRTGFFLPFSDVGQRKCEEFFEDQTVVGAVYMKSFGRETSDEGCPLDSTDST